MEPEFKSFRKIESYKKIYMTITQKIHGTNGQIYIKDGEIYAGSRNRWLTVDNDNAGFCKFVMQNKERLIQVLGEGRHFGEWCGKGINAGEGLSTKIFVLFDWKRYRDQCEHFPFLTYDLPVRVVPCLYTGKFSMEMIDEIMEILKTEGSRLVPVNWYMKPEGIVIELNGQLFKKVFEQEDSAWAQVHKVPNKQLPEIDVSHLLQPIRFKKILGRDEDYVRNYPENIRELVSLYTQDLTSENQLSHEQAEDRAFKKSYGKSIYPFIKEVMQEYINE